METKLNSSFGPSIATKEMQTENTNSFVCAIRSDLLRRDEKCNKMFDLFMCFALYLKQWKRI